jgi:hypothetical protein
VRIPAATNVHHPVLSRIFKNAPIPLLFRGIASKDSPISAMMDVHGENQLPASTTLAKRGARGDEMEHLRQRLDHMYLITSQISHDVASRGQLLVNITATINRRHSSGIAKLFCGIPGLEVC